MAILYTAEEIDAAKDAMLKANGWTDAYVRAIAWRASGEDMGVSARRNPSGSRSRDGNGATTTATPR
jgi:branched-chain amino acid aminotransferase